MRIFVCEYVTGGGLLKEALPVSLVREGDLMLRALVQDLTQIHGVEVVVSRDPRLPALDRPRECVVADTRTDVWSTWRRLIRSADAVWPIAPETNGVLERLSALVLEEGRVLLGTSPATVALTASKRATAGHLAECGIAAIPTYSLHEVPLDRATFWVVKPDDGAGCTDTRLYARRALREALLDRTVPVGHVVQPYLEGTAASLSLLSRGGAAWLLSCNRQDVALENGALHLGGVLVNGLSERRRAQALARRVASALPGLWGYVGVDVIFSAGQAWVVEINPRLTTSYVGLRGALGINPAAMVLALERSDPRIPRDTAAGRTVYVNVELGHAA